MDLLQGVTVALLMLLAWVGAIVWLRRRGYAQFSFGGFSRGPGVKPAKRMQVMERVALTPQHSLHLVRVDDRVVLVASAPGGCSVLSPMDDDGESQC